MLQRHGLVYRPSCACARACECQHVIHSSSSTEHARICCGACALPRFRAVARYQKQILDHTHRQRRHLAGTLAAFLPRIMKLSRVSGNESTRERKFHLPLKREIWFHRLRARVNVDKTYSTVLHSYDVLVECLVQYNYSKLKQSTTRHHRSRSGSYIWRAGKRECHLCVSSRRLHRCKTSTTLREQWQ